MRQLFKFEHFLGIGLFVNAVKRGDTAQLQVVRHGLVRGEHELFDQAMRDITLATDNSGHAAFGIEGKHALGQIEIHRATPRAPGIENQRKIAHIAKPAGQRRIARTGNRIALDYLIYRCVRHALRGTNDARREFRILDFAVIIELEEHAHYEAILMRIQRAHAVRQLLGQHGHGAIGKIDGSASQTSFAVERRIPRDIVGHVGDVHLKMPASRPPFDVYSIIEIACRFAIDGYDRQMAKIPAALAFGVPDGPGGLPCLLLDIVRKSVRQMMFADQNLHVEAEFTGLAQDFDDTANCRNAGLRESSDLNVYDRAFQLRQAQRLRLGKLLGFVLGTELRRQLLARRDYDFVMKAGFVRSYEVTAMAVMKKTNDGRVGAAQDFHYAAFGARRRAGRMAGVAAFDAGKNPIAVHGVSQLVRRNKEIAIELTSWRLGDYKAVTIAMRHQPACELIRIALGWLRLRARSCRRFCCRARFGPRTRETILAASQFLHEVLALQPR